MLMLHIAQCVVIMMNVVFALERITLTYPTGLMFTRPNTDSPKFRCLLQQNSVELRQNYKNVFMLPSILSPPTCQSIINAAEAYAQSTSTGWTSSRHIGYPTTDLPVDAIFGRFSSVHGIINGQVLPRIAECYSLTEDHLRIGELFVAKYEFKEGKQKGLGLHKDGTPWSFVICLNDSDEFSGGGTFFTDISKARATPPQPCDDEERGVLMRPEPGSVGSCVIFSGKNRHRGEPITGGLRYILTGFIDYCPPLNELEYCAEFDGTACSHISVGDELVSVVGQSNADDVDVTGLGVDEVKELLTRSAECRDGGKRQLSVVVRRVEFEDETGQAERAHLEKNLYHTLSTGNFFSLDDCLGSDSIPGM